MNYLLPWEKCIDPLWEEIPMYRRYFLNDKNKYFFIRYSAGRNGWSYNQDNTFFKIPEEAMAAYDIKLAKRFDIIFLTEEQAEKYKLLL